MSVVTQSLTLSALDSDALDTAMANALRVRGFTVTEPGQLAPGGDSANWESPLGLAARLDMHVGSLSRLMRLKPCPPFPSHRGPSGRTLALIATPELEAYLVKHKKRRKP